jgi:hypothetical protein
VEASRPRLVRSEPWATCSSYFGCPILKAGSSRRSASVVRVSVRILMPNSGGIGFLYKRPTKAMTFR